MAMRGLRNSFPASGTSERIPTLSLFSGAGGLDIGFAMAGFDIRGCVEIEPAYTATLQANVGHAPGFEDTRIHCTDIRKFDCGPYKQMGIRCVIGGPPCQTFSAAGRRAGGVIGTEDERGQLFRAYCKILRELKPDVFVFENVYGLPGANGGKPWAEIIDAFSEIGYSLRAEVLDAADYGVPQHRERLIMVGFREGEFVFPLPTHGPDSPTGTPLVSVEEAILDLQDPHEPFHDNLGGLYGHLLPLVPEGLNYAFFTAEMGHPEPVFAWRSKFHDLLYKVDRRAPCRTIKAQPGKFTGPFHWKNRHFTDDELKRIQTFPDDYVICGSSPKVLEQIGNSVPPLLSYAIAVSVKDQLLDCAGPQRLPVRPAGFKSTFRQRQRLRSQQFAAIAQSAIEEQYGTKRKKAGKVLPRNNDSFYLNPQTMFDRRRLKDADCGSGNAPLYKILISNKKKHVDLEFERCDTDALGSFQINISGLQKYLPDYDTLSASGRLADVGDVFHVWGAIEEALVQRSRFFTLIDIYGHYANRGDTVRISGRFNFSDELPLIRAINFFTSSLECGEFMDIAYLQQRLTLSKDGLDRMIAQMRDVRFDIRTSKTHPIIGPGRVLCTYPFPLLSPRALVESKAQLLATA